MSFDSSAFREALTRHQALFDVALDDVQIERLAAYYEIVLEHNPLLHLVGPSSAEEFATRHILESLALLKHLKQDAQIADVGAGAGLPSIPCLLVRAGLRSVLIESKEKKAAFLETAVTGLGLAERATVVARQFSEADITLCDIVTCRALDKFTQKLPQFVRWSRDRKMLLFGGDSLGDALQANGLAYVQELMPLSTRRYLFVVERQI